MNKKAEEVKAEVVGSEERPGPMAIAALVCGILSLLCGWVPVVGFPLLKGGQYLTRKFYHGTAYIY